MLIMDHLCKYQKNSETEGIMMNTIKNISDTPKNKKPTSIIEDDIIDVFSSDIEVASSSNLPSTEVQKIEVDQSVLDDIDLEFYYARNNLIKILETSREVLDSTAELAIESGHPRMVEVYSGLIKNLADVNKSLFEIREKKMQMQGDMEVEHDKQVVNNNAIFVGSTDDLLEMMKNKQNN